MSRYTRTPVTSGYEVQSQLNQNFSDIQIAIEDTLSRVGDSPNHMITDLDMNSYRIYNLPYATSNTEPVTYAQWLGSAGSTTVSGFFKWTAVATASQTLFSGITPTYTPGSNNIDVYINGVYQHPGAYTETSGSSITFSSGLDAGDAVLVNIKAVDALDTLSTVARVERKIATASQTLFTLTTLTYNIGANNLSVYVNGLRMVAGVDYTETSSSSVTFTSGLALNDEVVFVTGEVTSGSIASDASAVTYKQSAAATTKTVQAKLQEVVSVDDFGAVGDGVTDDTAAIQAAVDATASRGSLVLGAKEYKISSPISLSRSLSIIGKGKGISRILCASCSAFVATTGISFLSISGLSMAHDVRYTTTVNINTAVRMSALASNDWHTYSDLFIDGFSEAFYAASAASCVWRNVTSVYTKCGITAAGTSCINNQVLQCSFSCNDSIATATVSGSYGFKIGDGTTNCEGFSITDCLVFGVAKGVWNNASINVSVRGCILDAIGEFGILQQSTSTAGCINNIYDSNYIGMRGAADTGIYLANSYAGTDSQNRGTIVQNNEITVYATYTYNYGILIDGTYEKRNSISANRVTGATIYDCRVSSGSSHRIADNYWATNGFSTAVQVMYTNNEGIVASASWPSPVGSFTPTVVGATTPGTCTYSAQYGSYKLIDKTIFFNLKVIYTGHTGTGDLRISGLPVACKAATDYSPSVVVNAENLTFPASTTSIIGIVGAAASYIELRGSGSGTAPVPVGMDAAANLNISGFYEIA